VPNERARELVDAAVSRHVEAWSEILGIASTDVRFAQFREDVMEALHACMRTHIAIGDRRHKRFSDLRKDFLSLARAAEATATRLRGVHELLKHLPPMQHDPAFRLVHDPQATAFELGDVAEAARRHADDCKRADRGGELPMQAFSVLAQGLVGAYQDATNRTGVGRGAREGQLLDLYEAVLPIAREIAEAVTGKELEVSDDPGEYLHRLARHRRGA
jgi:hypothetical protein